MTREERIKKLRHLITCMKCEVSGKCCDDNCPTQYDAGNMGEIIENLEEVAKALEQQSCEDAVSRKDVHDMLENLPVTVENKWFNWLQKACIRLAELPSVTPQSKTGHWIKTPKAVMGEGYMWYCDNCEHQVYQDSSRPYPSEKYCPNCGFRMVKPQEREDEE